MKICLACNGKKKLPSFGGMIQDCYQCFGVGMVEEKDSLEKGVSDLNDWISPISIDALGQPADLHLSSDKLMECLETEKPKRGRPKKEVE